MAESLLSIVRNIARLAELQRAGLLDTPPDAAFDRLTTLAARIVKAPVALVSLVDRDRQFFKSCFGLPEPFATHRETPLSHSFCKHVVGTGEPLIVEDARKNAALRTNPSVRELGIIAYAGIPLRTSAGHVLGSFCVIDHEPRPWAYDEVTTLQDLAACAMSEIELRTLARDAQKARVAAEARVRQLEQMLALR